MASAAEVFDYAIQLAQTAANQCGTSAVLSLAMGMAPDAANRTGLYADTTAAAEKIGFVVGAITGPIFTRNGSTVDASFPGAVTITGNLTVNGTTTTVNSTVVDIADRVVHFNHTTGNVAVPSAICGFSIHRGASAGVDRDHAGVFWVEGSSEFAVAYNTGGDDATLGAYLALHCGAITAASLTLGTPLPVTSGGNGLATATLGDIRYGSAANTLSALAGNTTTTRKFLRQTGDGVNSAAPAWDTIAAGDIPSLTTATYVLFGDGTGKPTGDAGLTYTAASDLLIINHNAAALPAVPEANGTMLQIGGLDATATRILVDGFASSGSFTGRRANGTNAIPTGIVNGSSITAIQAMGYTSAGAYTTASCATIALQGTETWSATANGSQIVFQTTPNTTTTAATKFTIGQGSATFATSCPVTISDTTASTTTTTGALIVSGGLGVAGQVTVGGAVSAATNVLATQRIIATSSVTTADATGRCSFWRSGGTIGTAGDMVFQADLAAAAAAFVFRSGLTTPATIATLSPGTIAATTPCWSLVGTSLITGAVTDGYTAGERQAPTYSGAFTVTRHNYLDLLNPVLAASAVLTDACIFRLDAALGTHKATTASDKTGNAKSGTLIINVNGTLFDIQLYAH